jgi:programmed cell death 8 (apoptosis-inducing factor)
VHAEEESEHMKVSVTLMQGALKEHLGDCDYVVLASTNVTPDVEIAKRSALEVDAKNGGIMVNASLEAYDGLFVAGSAASYHDAVLGRRRVDFYDNALNSGLLAGQNMASEDGRLRRYVHQPTFRCVLPGTGVLVEAVGQINSDYSTAAVWLCKRDPASGKPLQNQTAFERGIIFYLRKNVVVGIACCNATELLDAARDVLTEQLSFEEASTRLLLAPDQWLRIIKTK